MTGFQRISNQARQSGWLLDKAGAGPAAWPWRYSFRLRLEGWQHLQKVEMSDCGGFRTSLLPAL